MELFCTGVPSDVEYCTLAVTPPHTGLSQRTELPKRTSKPPAAPVLAAPCPQMADVAMIEDPNWCGLQKMQCTSSNGVRKLPILNVPKLPCRPTNDSRPARVQPPASH